MRLHTQLRPQSHWHVHAPADLHVEVFDVGRRRLAVLRWSSAGEGLPDVLSEAERDVVTRVLRGLSNAEIAAQRRTSVRTIANQLACIFRKLGVQSRHELHAALLRRRVQ